MSTTDNYYKVQKKIDIYQPVHLERNFPTVIENIINFV